MSKIELSRFCYCGYSDYSASKIVLLTNLRVVIKLTGMDIPMLLREENKIGNRSRSAYQDAVEYGIDVWQLEYLLTLTPAERLKRHDAALALVLAVREAGIRYYGFDPRHPEAPL